MRGKRFAYVLGMMAAGILLLGTIVYASWNVTEYAIHILSMSSFKVSIQEEYQQPDHVEPGQTVIKKVNVKNEGDADCFVRISAECFLGRKSEAGEFQKEENLDPEMIIIHYNTDFWEYREDGYWYYKDVLKAGELTKKPLMDSFYLSEKADNRYKRKEARIVIRMESIQAESGVMETIWGITEKSLGINYQPCTCETVTSVTLDKDHKLTVEGDGKDLFTNFKNLCPGCSRSQTIRVSNESEENVEVMLRAENIQQETMTEQKQKLVQELLTKYAVIEVKEENKILYSGTADGNLNGTGQSMKNNISLGTFAPGESRNLIVKLSVSPDMDNEYQSLLGKVKWVFTAQNDGENDGENGGENSGENGGETSNKEDKIIGTVSVNPKTGDETTVWVKWFALAVSFVVLLIGSKMKYGKEQES